MFFKNSGFKQLLKSAYKSSGLKLGNDGMGIIAAGSYWTLWMDLDAIKKEKKAALIELAGDLPRPGEQVKIEGEMVQIEIPDGEIMGALTRSGEEKTLLINTGIVIDTDHMQIRLFQDEQGGITAVSEGMCRLIDKRAIEDDEARAEGPYLGKNGRLYWETDQCVFEVCHILLDGEMKELTDYLEGIKIEKGKRIKVSKENREEEEEEA